MDCVLDCSVDEQIVPGSEPRDLRVKVETPSPPASFVQGAERGGVEWHWVSDNVAPVYIGVGVY